ncbi:pyridoxamine 5'-phosphate oxidase family protein [Psychromarinibacter sp. C21-152]|uniref:Pyridoxamine 5'-phosphate oxidase family protein n=1 Tax=Psychromarinibacter sediminicola TaxID=3033385 RepID=A0AAE3NTL6_9RHOB|nr:pyridoxamine 5'-phosphate oxidase family protein [Psychromarinibacter sediminicola]MDF0600332.1 pyridoxamine 5'-phosphate oxidase family protein [Psychromarinibacter sediminicola]
MADTDRTRTDATGQLFDELERVHAGMLGVDGSGRHMQPMTHFLDRDARCLRFITASDTDLVAEIGLGAQAQFCVIGKDHDFYACLKGPVTVSEDREKLDELWSSVAEAWFEDGREDTKVTLLEMPVAEAAVWSSTGSTLTFAWEIAKANVADGKTPDVGEHKIIDFRTAA